MKKRDEQAYKHFLAQFEHQWDLCRESRDAYDEDLEYYVGYRNENDYPNAYNMTFPQLLPRIMTMLARMLGQIYQGNTNEIVAVRPRKRQDVGRVPRVQGLLNYQLETLNNVDKAGGSYLFNYQWMCNALSWGTGVAKVYWRKEERIAPRKINIPVPQYHPETGQMIGVEQKQVTIEEPQIVYDAPYAEVLHPKLFVPHPFYKNIQLMPSVHCVYRRSLDYIKRMEKKGIYRNLKDLGYSRPRVGDTGSSNIGENSYHQYGKSIEIEGYHDTGGTNSEYITPSVDVVESYGKYIFPEDESSYTVGSGLKIKGKESEAIAHIGNYKTLLSLQKNTYGYRPFFNIEAYMHPEMFGGIGIIRLGKHIQEQYDTLANTRFEGALMEINPMLQVRNDADIPPEAMIFKPFGIVPVDEIGRDVAPLVTSNMSQSKIFQEQEDFFKSTIEDMTGMYRYNMGATPTRQENVGTIYSLQQMGESRTKLLLMTMDFMGFQPMLKHMMLLNTFHLPQDFESRIITNRGEEFSPMFAGDIHPDYDFTARYTSMEPALGKMYRSQQLMQYAQMWMDSPYLQHHEFMKAILEMHDFQDSDRYLKSPQQLQQEQQAQMQQQQQAEMMAASLQDSMSAKQDERTMQREIVKGMMK